MGPGNTTEPIGLDPLFLATDPVTRREELVNLLSVPHLTLLTPRPPRERPYTRPDDHVFFVDSEAEIEDPTMYQSIATATGRRVLVYEVGGDIPVLESAPAQNAVTNPAYRAILGRRGR